MQRHLPLSCPLLLLLTAVSACGSSTTSTDVGPDGSVDAAALDSPSSSDGILDAAPPLDAGNDTFELDVASGDVATGIDASDHDAGNATTVTDARDDAASVVDAATITDARDDAASDSASSADVGRAEASPADSGALVDGGTPDAGRAYKRVFVSSTAVLANFGGYGSADTICQTLADGASLGGIWMAWVSDSISSPLARFTPSTLPYRRVDGVTTIAANWAGLTSGTLVNGVGTDENGNAVANAETWTATTPTGAYAGGSCSDWTDPTNGAPFAGVGISDRSGSDWTDAYLQFCDRSGLHLYCFEQ